MSKIIEFQTVSAILDKETICELHYDGEGIWYLVEGTDHNGDMITATTEEIDWPEKHYLHKFAVELKDLKAKIDRKEIGWARYIELCLMVVNKMNDELERVMNYSYQ